MSDSVSEATVPKPTQSIVTGGIQWTLFALALPALLEQLLTFFVGFYDTYLSGQISAAASLRLKSATPLRICPSIWSRFLPTRM